MHRPLIFLSYGTTTSPLAHFLARRFTLVVPHPEVAKQLRGRGIFAIGWGALADAARVAALPTLATRMASRWCDTLRSQADRLYRLGGRCHGDEIIAALYEVFEKHLARQMAAVEFATSLSRSGQLAAVVVHEDATGVMRAFLEGTRRFGVPSIHVPHGVAFETRLIGADVHGSAHTDVIAAAGVVQRDWFLRRGVASEQIILTGNPAWDHLCTQRRVAPASLGLPPGRVVTVATSWFSADAVHRALTLREHDRRTWVAFKAVTHLQATGLQLRVILKLHPSAPAQEECRLQRMASDAGVSIDLIARDRLPEILRASDVLVSLPSTVAIEAVLVGTPVIVPDFSYEGDAVLTPPAAVDSLARMIREVLFGSAATPEFALRRQDFLERYNGRCDGRAAERVAHLVDEIATRAMRVRQNGIRAQVATQQEDPREGPGATLRDRLGIAYSIACAGNHDSVLMLLDEIAASEMKGPLPDEFFTLRGQILCRLGRIREAEQCFRSALDSCGGAQVHAGLGTVLLERGKRSEAYLHLREAIRLDPHDDSAWCGLGVLAGLNGDPSEALALLERALAINPENPDAHRALEILRRDDVRGDQLPSRLTEDSPGADGPSVAFRRE